MHVYMAGCQTKIINTEMYEIKSSALQELNVTIHIEVACKGA